MILLNRNFKDVSQSYLKSKFNCNCYFQNVAAVVGFLLNICQNVLNFTQSIFIFSHIIPNQTKTSACKVGADCEITLFLLFFSLTINTQYIDSPIK